MNIIKVRMCNPFMTAGKKDVILQAVSLLAIVTTSCGSVNHEQPNSEVKWGVHSSGAQANLLNLLPGQSVEVCGQSAEQIAATVSGIQKWSTVIGRWGKFSVKPCGSHSNLVINVQGSSRVGLNYFSQNPGLIYVLSSATKHFLEAILLHEIGHSWGLCDQYTDAGRASCSRNTGPYQDNNEVMGTTMPDKLTLTEGDKVGIRAAANMDIPANRAWNNHLNMMRSL